MFSVLLDGSSNLHTGKASVLLLFLFSALFAYSIEILYYFEKIEKNNQVYGKNEFDYIEFCETPCI